MHRRYGLLSYRKWCYPLIGLNILVQHVSKNKWTRSFPNSSFMKICMQSLYGRMSEVPCEMSFFEATVGRNTAGVSTENNITPSDFVLRPCKLDTWTRRRHRNVIHHIWEEYNSCFPSRSFWRHQFTISSSCIHGDYECWVEVCYSCQNVRKPVHIVLNFIHRVRSFTPGPRRAVRNTSRDWLYGIGLPRRGLWKCYNSLRHRHVRTSTEVVQSWKTDVIGSV